MTREITAHHDTATLGSPAIAPALILHRFTPVWSVPELVAQASLGGLVSRALDHARDCVHCGVDQLCSAGLALVSQITPPTRTRGWRALREAGVAQARAKQRKGAA